MQIAWKDVKRTQIVTVPDYLCDFCFQVEALFTVLRLDHVPMADQLHIFFLETTELTIIKSGPKTSMISVSTHYFTVLKVILKWSQVSYLSF